MVLSKRVNIENEFYFCSTLIRLRENHENTLFQTFRAHLGIGSGLRPSRGFARRAQAGIAKHHGQRRHLHPPRDHQKNGRIHLHRHERRAVQRAVHQLRRRQRHFAMGVHPRHGARPNRHESGQHLFRFTNFPPQRAVFIRPQLGESSRRAKRHRLGIGGHRRNQRRDCRQNRGCRRLAARRAKRGLQSERRREQQQRLQSRRSRLRALGRLGCLGNGQLGYRKRLQSGQRLPQRHGQKSERQRDWTTRLARQICLQFQRRPPR